MIREAPRPRPVSPALCLATPCLHRPGQVAEHLCASVCTSLKWRQQGCLQRVVPWPSKHKILRQVLVWVFYHSFIDNHTLGGLSTHAHHFYGPGVQAQLTWVFCQISQAVAKVFLPVFSWRLSWGDSASQLLQVDGRIQLLEAIGLRGLVLWDIVLGGHLQFHVTCFSHGQLMMWLFGASRKWKQLS